MLVTKARKLVPEINPNWIVRNYNQVNTAEVPFVAKNRISDSNLQSMINTKTGKVHSSNSDKIVVENNYPSALLSQWIKVGNQSHLIFFDTGASSSLISHDLAAHPSVEQTSDDSINLSVVGGTEISSTFGTFRLALGPTDMGEYYELYTTGMSKVTVNFPFFSTTEIRKE